MWNKFLIEWNGISLFHDLHISPTPDIELFTDVAATITKFQALAPHAQPHPLQCPPSSQLKNVTVKTYLAGVRFFYLQRGITTIFDYRGSGALNRLQSIMRGYKKLQAPTPRKQLPITFTVLARIVCTLRAGVLGPLNDLVMECMCLTAFFGFLRCGEITCAARFDPSANICLSDIKFDFAKRKCTILLKASKTDPFRVGVPIILFSNSRLCPFSSLRKLFYTRTLQQASSEDALFVDAQHTGIVSVLAQQSAD
ncbi:uncharacterized protein LOC125375983 [Haliotis rufescens]|uniref:uncharacterized protein LOC125375983 n=1 Tax=Haliotis rufescens TaxID=6454 RepID=UPI00201F4B34|nr:uncharacterized protein LOC125375983 [Haliotis rufescens]